MSDAAADASEARSGVERREGGQAGFARREPAKTWRSGRAALPWLGCISVQPGAAGAHPAARRPGTGLALRPGMTKIIPALLLGLALLLSAPVARAGEPELRFGPCAAVRVLDGSTADLVCRGRIMPVRLRNVAAPQSGQAGYGEAARALAELLRARELYIAFGGAGAPATEPDGRLSVYLYDKSGANQNVMLVLLGWGSYDSTADSEALDRSFRAAQDDARNEHRALWTVRSFSARSDR